METLPGLFGIQAAEAPDAPALIFEDHVVTYGELAARAERLAVCLQDFGVGPEVVVGILSGHCIERVVGIIGVLMAGGAWLPLSPSDPWERVTSLLTDAAAPVLLAPAGSLSTPLPEGIRVLLFDGEPSMVPSSNPFLTGEGARSKADPDNLAVVLYSSVPHGALEGAAVPHCGLSNRLLRICEAYDIRPRDVTLHQAASGSEALVWELFGPLVSGARVVLACPGTGQDLRSLARLMAEQGVTLASLEALLDQPDVAACATALRQVFAGSEAVPAGLPAFPAAAGFQAPPGRADGPGIRIDVLDAEQAPVAAGIPGELCLGGVGLARGYLGRPELTAERFLPDPFPPPAVAGGGRLYRTGNLVRSLANGKLQFLGRISEPVKSRVFLDRPAMAEPFVTPRGDLERTIAAAWREVLRLPRVGVREQFFEVGGSSLLLPRLQGLLEKALGRELAMMDLFRYPTIEELARHLADQKARETQPSRASQIRIRTQTRQEALLQLSNTRARHRRV
ncbi:MAG TPA: non-ribosomal peptide synthetase [Thermoanaerobaculia bacterium]|nr:non-ribosomal peptide synthetase [Thermoanaerobaculia bacterium]